MFEVNIEQYICVKLDPSSTKQAGGSRLKSTTCFFCRIPDSPKYRTLASKPMPGNKHYVSVCGFLIGVDRSGNNSKVEQFLINIESVTFCGQYIQPTNAPTFVLQSCEWVNFFNTAD